MGKLALTLAVLFLSSLAVCSGVSDFPENDVRTGDLPSELPESTPVILLPTELEDSAGSKQPENELRTVESKDEVTTVTFRPADHRLDGPSESPVDFHFPFRHRRPCRHGRRPFNPSDLTSRGREIPYGNDMILATEKSDSDSESSDDLTPRAQFRHHFHHHHHHHHHDGEPELEEKGQTFQAMRHDDVDQDLDHHGRKRFHHRHRLSEREDDEREDDEREEEEEEHPHHHHHQPHHHEEDEKDKEHHPHHHHHRHHHHEEDEEEEYGGLLMKFRKFLMDRF